MITPPSTQLTVEIIPTGVGFDTVNADSEWLAQFYVRPNRFFFPDPASLSLVGPVDLKLSEKKEVRGARKQTFLCPDPDGAFAMMMVFGGPGSGLAKDAFSEAYDVAAPILDRLATKYDHPLPIAQTVMVGVPSGVISVIAPRPSNPKAIDLNSDEFSEDYLPHLKDARALYREGISSNNPFHQFITLWKTYENLVVYVAIGGRKTLILSAQIVALIL